MKPIDFFMVLENISLVKAKKIKRPFSKSSSESEYETDKNFYQFIVLESLEETPIIKLSPFLIKKSNRNTLQTNQHQESYKWHHNY